MFLLFLGKEFVTYNTPEGNSVTITGKNRLRANWVDEPD